MAGEKRPQGYGRAEYRQLVEGRVSAAAWGSVDWVRVNGSLQARIDVSTELFEHDEVAVNIKLPAGRPEQPSICLLIRGMCAVRLDVNGDHGAAGPSAVRGRTHWQRAETSDEVSQASFELCDDAPEIDPCADVPHWAYRDLLWWFLDQLHIGRDGVMWDQPGEGAFR